MFEISCVILGACVVLSCTSVSKALAEDHAEGPQFVIQSHRGAGNLAPENTIPSFELAWCIGAVPEADVRSTSDGVLIAFHDGDLKRVAPTADYEIRSKSVNDLEWSVVSKLDVGCYKGEEFRGQYVPRMSDVLDLLRGHKERMLYVDTSEDRLRYDGDKTLPLDELAAFVHARGVDEQVILASTDYAQIREWKRLLPKSKTLLWNGGDEAALRKRMAALRAADFADITQLQIHVKVLDLNAPEPFMPSSEFLREVKREIHPKGVLFQVLVIGSDDPEAYHKLIDLGVESFASDDPMVPLKGLS